MQYGSIWNGLAIRAASKDSCTRNSCAQLGAPTGSVPNLYHPSIGLELARCAHIRFDLCARIEIFVSCHNFRGSGSTTCRSFPQTYPRFFLRFDRFPKRIYNARAVRGGAALHPVHRTASEIYLPTYLPTYIYVKTCQNPYMVQTGNTSEMPRWGDNSTNVFCYHILNRHGRES